MARTLLRIAGIAGGAAVLVVSAFVAEAVPSDDVADVVFGQPTFTTFACNNGGVSASSLCRPVGMAQDASGNLYVADVLNNRILEYDAPLATGNTVADRVIGQPNFTSNTCNSGGLSAASVCQPGGLVIDSAGRLWVSDINNNRLLVFQDPVANDLTADFVIGQPSFATNTCAPASASTFCSPQGLEVDAAGNLWVVSAQEHRVLQFNTPLTTDTTADRIFGQADAVSTGCNNAVLMADALCFPVGVDFSSGGQLAVTDIGNSRILVYNDPLNPLSDSTADFVLGQPTFGTTGCNQGGISATSLCTPFGVAYDGASSIYVADRGNHRVLRFDGLDPTADAVYGQGGSFTSAACGGTTATSLCFPLNVAINASGSLFMAQGHSSEGAPDIERVTVRLACSAPVDTECDGFANPQQTLHVGPSNTNAGFDNCPAQFNPLQPNTDGNYVDNSPPYSTGVDDRTWPNSDAAGDACDSDDDNDARSDPLETSGGGCSSFITNPLLRDTDGDRFLDGAECALGFDPTNSASKPALAACGAAGDADGDKIQSRLEVCYYNTNPNAVDSDGDAALDGAKDGCEVASFNADRIVNSIDQAMLAQGIGSLGYTVNVDINKDGVLNSIDQALLAQFIVPPGQCP